METKPKEHIWRIWYQVLAIFAVSISGFNAASLFYWTSPSIPIIVNDEMYNTNIDAASYLTVIPAIAMVIASPFYSILMPFVGRKYLILSMGFLHLTGWLLIAFSNSMIMLYTSRLIHGLADACLFSVVPIYIAEISTPSVRSTWGNIMMVLIYLGQFSINAVGYYFDLKTTAFIYMAFPILFLILFGLMPETPYYFLMKKNEVEAMASLKKLRQTDKINDEFEQIKQDVERQLSESGKFLDVIKIPSNRRALLISTLIRFIQQFSGLSAFALYTQYIFSGAVGTLNEGESAMIYSGMLAACNLLGSFSIDKLGRKLAMTISCAGCTIALFGEAAYFYLDQYEIIDLTGYGLIPLIGLCVYVLFLCAGLSIVPTTIIGELFSASIKAKATCVMNIIFAIFIGLSTKLFQVFTSNFGMYAAFAFFGAFAFLGIFISWFFVPVTEGKSLEEIQQSFKKNNV